MNVPDERTFRIAAGLLEMAQRRIGARYPFHCHFLATWRVQATTGVATVAVTVRQAAIHLLYHPAFVAACSLPELEGILHHEINHLLFGHVWEDPRQFADPDAWVTATEITANEFVPEPLPGQPLTLERFQFPPLEDTHTRYRRLVEKRADGDRKSPGSGEKWPNSASNDPQDEPIPLDDHSLWVEIREAGTLGRWLVGTAARKAAAGLTLEQWDILPGPLRRQLEQLSNGGQRGGTEILSPPAGRAATIPWGQRLRQYVRHATEPRPAFHRLPRRFPALLGIVPGQLRRPQRARVMAVIDTSGSISLELLKQISVELEHLRRRHDVVVVECDDTIQAVYPLTSPLSSVRGRGNTDLRVPFRPDILRQICPDVAVYFTDGLGPAPTSKPSVPVVWCLTPLGTRPAAWGWELRMKS